MLFIIFCTISLFFIHLEAAPGCIKPEPEPSFTCDFTVTLDTNLAKEQQREEEKYLGSSKEITNVTCVDNFSKDELDKGTTVLMSFYKGMSIKKNIYMKEASQHTIMWFQMTCLKQNVATIKLNNVWVELTNAHCAKAEDFGPNMLRDQGANTAEYIEWTEKLVV